MLTAGCFLLDIGIVFFYPLRLTSKCGIDSFDFIMSNCRKEAKQDLIIFFDIHFCLMNIGKEFTDLLMIVRHGGTYVFLGVVVFLHGLLLALCTSLLINTLCAAHKKVSHF